MEKNVLEFLENSQRMYGEKTACADMNNELTYTQLMNQAKFIGSCLSLKIKPTQGVPVYMDKTCNTLSFPVSPEPLNPQPVRHTLQAIRQD